MSAALTAAERASRVKLMIFDVDGVLTDGGLLFTAAGDAMKSFNSLDGHGVKLLGEAGIATAIITGRRSDIVAARAKELKIAHLFQGVENKLTVFGELIASRGRAAHPRGDKGAHTAPQPRMVRCGVAPGPPPAHPEVIARAHWVAEARGGHGAVREVCDAILRAQRRYDALLAAACGA